MVSLAAIGFATFSDYAQATCRKIWSYSPWLPFLVTPCGFAFAAAMTRWLAPFARGSGIPQTIAALDARSPSARNELLSLRVVAGKFAFTLVALLCGASVGREGPTVQIGASIMHSLGRLVPNAYREMGRGLILAGGAAGIAAAFNTPLAGIVFAIEELWQSFDQRTNGIVLTAVIFSGITSMSVLGDYTYFGKTTVLLAMDRSWIAVPVCGILGGALGGAFSRILIQFAATDGDDRVGWARARPIRFAFACGLILAVLGYFSGNTIYGTGYEEARALLGGSAQLPSSFGIMKMVATLVSSISGIPGGVFAPSLAAGAGFGAEIASVLPNVPVPALVILGMVGYFTGVVQAPLTALVIVMEMTDDRAMLLPLMATALLAQAASRVISPKPLYRSLATGFARPDIN